MSVEPVFASGDYHWQGGILQVQHIFRRVDIDPTKNPRKRSTPEHLRCIHSTDRCAFILVSFCARGSKNKFSGRLLCKKSILVFRPIVVQKSILGFRPIVVQKSLPLNCFGRCSALAVEQSFGQLLHYVR